MKKIAIVLAVLAAASCTRHHLNYQSSHENGTGNDDVYPAPQAQSSGGGGGADYSAANNNNYTNYNSGNGIPVDYNTPSYQTFYDGLSPYGSWINNQAYGYVWVPNAGAGFTPYGTNGNWVYTSYGWTWNSGYDWGWAPFHYGNWYLDPVYGWIWVPGYQWAPAWVAWGSYNGYYGWAPVEPGAMVSSGYSPPVSSWRFVPAQNITSANVANYYANNVVSSRSDITLISNASTYENHTYFSGPQREDVEQATSARIKTAVIHEAEKPVVTTSNPNNLSLYRPVINPASAKTAAPAKVTPVENLKPVTQSGEPVYNHSAPKPAAQQNHAQPASEPVEEEQPASNRQQHSNNNKLQQAPKQGNNYKPKSNQPQQKPGQQTQTQQKKG